MLEVMRELGRFAALPTRCGWNLPQRRRMPPPHQRHSCENSRLRWSLRPLQPIQPLESVAASTPPFFMRLVGPPNSTFLGSLGHIHQAVPAPLNGGRQRGCICTDANVPCFQASEGGNGAGPIASLESPALRQPTDCSRVMRTVSSAQAPFLACVLSLLFAIATIVAGAAALS